MTTHHGWTFHPGVRHGEKLTAGERAADRMRNGMGSWRFVFGFLAFMALWAVSNSIFYLFGSHGKHGFDPYPYILLNLFLSMLAGLQGAILLISAKRQDQIASELAKSDYEINQKTLEISQQQGDVLEALHQLTKEVHEHIIGQRTPGFWHKS